MDLDPARDVLRTARRAAREGRAPLLLAVSGGLDSMVLLHAMATVARARIAAVATFDHGTGAAATRAAGLVARTAAELGLPVVVGRMDDGIAPRASREAAWRGARYRFLREVAAPLGAAIATAHTADDQVETVLLRVLRGSGARGLAGLFARGDVVRPFLTLRRGELAAYARASGVRWVEDPSNGSREFLRNRVRHDLLPALRRAAPDIEERLLDVARRAAAWRVDMEAIVEVALAPRTTPDGALVVASAELAGYDRDSLAVLWSSLAGRVGLALDRRGTDRLAAFTMSSPRTGSMPLAGGWCLEAREGTYLLRRAPRAEWSAAALPEAGDLEWGPFLFRVGPPGDPVARPARRGADSWVAALPADARPVVRPWGAGDRLAAAGGQPPRRVKRYLSDAGVRGLDRAGWPVVVAGNDVVWIPGVRRSDAATARSGRPVRHYVCERIDR